jgi:hypothetical protein
MRRPKYSKLVTQKASQGMKRGNEEPFVAFVAAAKKAKARRDSTEFYTPKGRRGGDGDRQSYKILQACPTHGFTKLYTEKAPLRNPTPKRRHRQRLRELGKMETAAFKNRRRRKRLRASARRAADGGDRLQETPASQRARGAWGAVSTLTRSDLVSIRAAARRGWHPSKRVCRRLVHLIVRQGLDADWDRMTIAACATLIEMTAQDQRRERQLLEELRANSTLLSALLSDVKTRRALFFGIRALRPFIIASYGSPGSWRAR